MAVRLVTLNRRATDQDEPSNREILDRLDRFIESHDREHKDLERRIGVSDIASAVSRSDVDALKLVAVDVKLLRDFRIQVETLGRMMRWVVGGSLLAFLGSVATLIVLLSHLGATGTP